MDQALVPLGPLPTASRPDGLCGTRKATDARTASRGAQASRHVASASQLRRDPQAPQAAAPPRQTRISLTQAVSAAAAAATASTFRRHRRKPTERRSSRGRRSVAVQASDAPESALVERKQSRAWIAAFSYLALLLLHHHILRGMAAQGAAIPPVGLVAAVHAAVFLPAAFVFRGNQTGQGFSPALIVAFAASEILSWLTLGRLPPAGDLSLNVALLSGLGIPYTMLLSKVLLKRQFRTLAWAGGLLVALGVAIGGSSLGPPALPSLAQMALLVGALAVPGTALIGKEALLTRSRCGVVGGGFLLALIQFAASSIPTAWMPTPATPSQAASLSLLWSEGAGSLWFYIVACGALRLSLMWAIRVASAPTVQLLNTMAVPLGAATVTSFSPWTMLAVLVSCSGGGLFLKAHLGRPVAGVQVSVEEPPAVAPSLSPKDAFMKKLKVEKATRERKKARLERMKARWIEAERQQMQEGLSKTPLPEKFEEEEPEQEQEEQEVEAEVETEAEAEAEVAEVDAGGPSGAPKPKRAKKKHPGPPLKDGIDEEYMGKMWEKWMRENPEAWRRMQEEEEEAEAEEERRR